MPDDISAKIIIENLKRFNRKERYHLIRDALGNPDFKLGKPFWGRLRKCLGLQEEVPEKAFMAMDYHLDWIYASLFLTTTQEQPPYRLRSDKKISGTQQDIDLLIAYESDGICHVVMLEAKGALPFGSKEEEALKSKVERLVVIWGDNGNRWCNVEPHFVITSPKPLPLRCEEWPKWMLSKKGCVQWLKLDIAKNLPLQKVTRLHRDPTNKKQYKNWKVEQIKL